MNVNAVQVLQAAVFAAGGDRGRAEHWFKNQPLAEFDGKTAAELVADGRGADVLRLISTIEAGCLG
jgi:hypothetical protein